MGRRNRKIWTPSDCYCWAQNKCKTVKKSISARKSYGITRRTTLSLSFFLLFQISKPNNRSNKEARISQPSCQMLWFSCICYCFVVIVSNCRITKVISLQKNHRKRVFTWLMSLHEFADNYFKVQQKNIYDLQIDYKNSIVRNRTFNEIFNKTVRAKTHLYFVNDGTF